VSEQLWSLIAVRAVIGSLALLTAVLAILSIASRLSQKPDHGNINGRVVGAAIIFSIPLAIAAFFGTVASAMLLAVDAPPPTYLFTAVAALVSFRAAVKHPGHGMEGCTKMFGLVASGYAFVWSIVSFEATGGVGAINTGAASARWIQPLVAALPFALLVLKLTDRKKRSLWLLTGALVFVAAAMALAFFPIENGFAAAILPRSDWLRFPLAGVAVALLLSLIPLTAALRANPNVRRVRLRDTRKNIRMMAAIMAAMGLSWAVARTIVDAAQAAV
jgi:hypothetical protein